MKPTPFALTACALLVAASLVAANPALAQTERKTVAGSSISLYNIAGHVTVEAGTGVDVIVEVERAGRDSKKLTIEVGEVRGRNSLRVMYPDNDIVYRDGGSRWQGRSGNNSSTQFSVRDDGTWGDERGRGSGHRVRVKDSGSGLEAWANLKVLVPAGKNLQVSLGVGDLSARGVTGDLRLEAASAHITVSNTNGNLTVDNGSGGVEMRDVKGDEISIDTGSGGVDFSGVTGKRCKIDTGSGGVTGAALNCDDVNIDVGSGSIRVDDATAPRVKLDAGSGGIRLALRNSPRDLHVDSGSGGVTISLPAIADAQVDIETGSGGIETDFPIEARRVERNHLRGTVGDGSGRIRISSGSGTVRLRKN